MTVVYSDLGFWFVALVATLALIDWSARRDRKRSVGWRIGRARHRRGEP